MSVLLLQIALVYGRLGKRRHRARVQYDNAVVEAGLRRHGQMAENTNIEDAKRSCTKLNLSGMNLKRLPIHAIEVMKNLRTLILDCNEGLEIAQDDIEILVHLPIEEVSIRSSEIGSETFNSLRKLPYLMSLDISGNVGLLNYSTEDGGSRLGPLADRLSVLNVSNCFLGSRWLDDILKCTKLVDLNVAGNQGLFIGEPQSFNRIKGSLTSLNVMGCSLDSRWLENILRQCTRLTSLDISGNDEMFSMPPTGSTFDFTLLKDTLTNLSAAWCSLSPQWIDSILGCTNLESLDISWNHTIGWNPKNFSKLKELKSLERLNAKETGLSAGSFNEICSCESLRGLDVSGNLRLGHGDALSFSAGLVELNVADTGLTEEGLMSICGPTRLERLNLKGNRCVGSVVSSEGFSFGKLRKTLAELGISNCGITSSRAVKAISECVELRKLDASWNSDLWNGADTVYFGCLKSRLWELDIKATGLPAGVLHKILEFDQLKILDIGSNSSCMGLGTCWECPGGMKETLREFRAEKTYLTKKRLQWILSEFTGLTRMDVSCKYLPVLVGNGDLNFGALKDTLVEFRFSIESKCSLDTLVSGLQKRLPRTRIVPCQSAGVNGYD